MRKRQGDICVGNSSKVAIDLFAGAGGLSLGLLDAGFDVRAGVEIGTDACETLRLNHPKMKVVESDITNVESSFLLEKAKIGTDELALVAGGPPCRGFSVSNKRNRCIENPTNALYRQFFRLVGDLSPKMFLLENVEGLCTLNKGTVLNDIIRISEDLGYFTNYFVVKSEDYGVPQKRRRVLFIGSKKRRLMKLIPPATKRLVSVREAIDDLPILENGNTLDMLEYSKDSSLSEYQDIMRRKNEKHVTNNQVTRNGPLALKRYSLIPQGGNWRNLPLDLMSNYRNLENCHRWIYYRLKWDEPSIVISNFRKNMLIHPDKNRGLSVREAARLQSFPDSYIFHGKLGSQQQQIANAVPPLMAKHVGRNLVKELGKTYEYR